MSASAILFSHNRVRAIEHETETKFHLDTHLCSIYLNANHEKCACFVMPHMCAMCVCESRMPLGN